MNSLVYLVFIAFLALFQPGSAFIPNSIMAPIQAAIENSLGNILREFDGENWAIEITKMGDLDLVVDLDSEEEMIMDIFIGGDKQRIIVDISEDTHDQVCDMSLTTTGEVFGFMDIIMGGNVDAVIDASIPNGAAINLNAIPNPLTGRGLGGNIVVDFETNPRSSFSMDGGSKSMVADIEVVSSVDLEVFSFKAGQEILTGHSWSLLILFFIFGGTVVVFMIYIWVLFVMKNFSNQLASTQQPSFSKSNEDLATVVCPADGTVNNWGANFCRGCGNTIAYGGSAIGRSSVGPGAVNPLYGSKKGKGSINL